SYAFLWAFLFGLVAAGLPLLLIQKAGTRIVRELRATINIRPLTGDRLVATDPWAMDAVFARNVLGLVDEGPEQVVELGSGHSTVLIARRLEDRGSGHVIAIDHLEEYAERTRDWLRDEGLGHRATVVHAPIVERSVEGRDCGWYDDAALDPALPDRIDLLVVDGPPDTLRRDARWPAVPVLQHRLAPDAVVLMDDGDRPDETRAALDWHDRLGGRMRYLPGGKGGWILRAGA
ncbi:MAG: hypothetical protein GWM90_18175, partial [Gemmatimonadetes bacterium]|nr:class I SAM-dependent methyltransferase [Gemmatimonadota bacterium]NIQ56276.1 class I SAM-dependent methyltransferase [Gemmatimonadota bacterium]NIU76464.1 hypothetical protein [Gammaproteobacteria bacterium]NIX45948.1 hypothetical protein [Gemmatimonadota bacterium]NIY10269.1 hypothetical protein [Gemmatimonadota bacterium]